MSVQQKAAAKAVRSRLVTTASTATPPVEYTLTAERTAALTASAGAARLGTAGFPGRLAHRIRRFGETRLAAERDMADLVRTPLHDEPPITRDEILGQRDRIEFLRITESRFQALRSTQQQAFTEFEVLAVEASAIRARLLRTFDVRFAKNAAGKKRVSAIRKGSGDPDLVQDVSDLLVLCGEHTKYLAGCPRGEAADVVRLREISPLISHLLAAKGMSEDALLARHLRDGAYVLVVEAENRFRIGAAYWYEGTDKMKDYTPFISPTRAGAAADPAADPADPTDPAPPAAPANVGPAATG